MSHSSSTAVRSIGRRFARRLLFSLVFVVVSSTCVSAALTTQTVYVELMVDDEETRLPHLWQTSLAKRLDDANRVLSNYCDVRFELAKFGRWDSDDRVMDLGRSLREFEHEVAPESGNIAIGFSSQYQFKAGRNGLGGTRGPMRGHILIREHAKNIHEPEKLEVLVHELGHFLGAAHSTHPQSVMRPVLGDGRALKRGYRIEFDPQNANILRLVSKEIRERSIRRYWQLSEATLKQLRVEYAQLHADDKTDPAAAAFLRSVDAALQRKATRPHRTPENERLRREIDRIFQESVSAKKRK